MRHRQRLQMVIGRALAAEIGGGALLRAERGQLQHAPDAGLRRRVEQGRRGKVMQPVEIAAVGFAQDADRVDHDMDAAQAVDPGSRRGIDAVIHGDLIGMPRLPHPLEHPVSVARQRLAQRAADEAIGTAYQDVHVIRLQPHWPIDSSISVISV